jgi:murein DD-endopeptidase MepM/ murein hydrolase activator NlpD
MDDIIVRSRYPRHGIYRRRKRKSLREDAALTGKISWQLLISLVILLLVIVIKSINSPATNYLTEKAKAAVIWNVELKSIFAGIGKLINQEAGKRNSGPEETGTDAATVSATAGVYEPGSSVEGDRIQDTGLSFILPVDGTLSSAFGERTDPMTGIRKHHNGVDLEAKNGSLIAAALDGVVIDAGTERTYGNYIKIRHNDGIMTVYAHCSQLAAEKGQNVRQGDIIAKVGDTGASVGTHLHFEIWKDGRALDPLNFISIPLK